MINVYVNAAGTISIPIGPLTEDEALDLAASILRLLGHMDFEKVRPVIERIDAEEKANERHLAALSMLATRGYTFHHNESGETWEKHFMQGSVVLTRADIDSAMLKADLDEKEKGLGEAV